MSVKFLENTNYFMLTLLSQYLSTYSGSTFNDKYYDLHMT